METRIKISIKDVLILITEFLEKDGYLLRKDYPVIFSDDPETCFFAFAEYRVFKNE